LSPKPYGWQAHSATVPDAAPLVASRGIWQPFWADLKTTATKPYGDKSTLEKAYGACVLLFAAAVLPMPYEYYFSLRVGVCIALGFFAAAAYGKRPRHSGWLAAIVILIVLYNPIMPLHIGMQLAWTAINAATIYALYRAKLALDRPAQGPSETTA